MRLVPTLFAAALAAVAVAHEFQGEDWEHDGEVRKGHPVGFAGEPRKFKEATWWERFQGKRHHHTRDAAAEAGVPSQLLHDHDHDIIPSIVPHHKPHHHSGKHHHTAHPGGHHHGGKHHGHHGHNGEHGKHHAGHKEHGEHKHGHHGHGHKHGFAPGPFEGEHPHGEHGWLMDRANNRKPVWQNPQHFERDLDTEDNTAEVDPDNEFFDSTDFDDSDFDNDDNEDDESGHLLARAIENAEVEADPNESSPDADYYDFGDDGDDDILAGELGDAQDVPDDDTMTEAELDADGDDEDDDEDSDDEDDDSEDPAKRWADAKRDAKKHHPKPKPKPKPKGWGIFPW